MLRALLGHQDSEPLMPQVAHDTDTHLVATGHVMAIYLKWHMCPCH